MRMSQRLTTSSASQAAAFSRGQAIADAPMNPFYINQFETLLESIEANLGEDIRNDYELLVQFLVSQRNSNNHSFFFGIEAAEMMYADGGEGYFLQNC